MKTVLRQGTLTPLTSDLMPRSPVLEPFLRLFPLPDLVVLCCVASECSCFLERNEIKWLLSIVVVKL